MKLNFLLLSVATILCSCKPATPGIEVYFSPNGGCTEAVVREIESANTSIKGQGYSFTSVPIAEALIRASKRVQVDLILDKSQRTERDSQFENLRANKVHVVIDAKHSIAHNKIFIIDNNTVLTGSFNFTKAAELHNAENLVIIHDPETARKYLNNWHLHYDHSSN